MHHHLRMYSVNIFGLKREKDLIIVYALFSRIIETLKG